MAGPRLADLRLAARRRSVLRRRTDPDARVRKAALLGSLWLVAFSVYGYVVETLRAEYLLPGVPGGAIGDSVTPVNAIRLVLRHYFGADLPPLEHVAYRAQKDTPLQMTRIRR